MSRSLMLLAMVACALLVCGVSARSGSLQPESEKVMMESESSAEVSAPVSSTPTWDPNQKDIKMWVRPVAWSFTSSCQQSCDNDASYCKAALPNYAPPYTKCQKPHYACLVKCMNGEDKKAAEYQAKNNAVAAREKFELAHYTGPEACAVKCARDFSGQARVDCAVRCPKDTMAELFIGHNSGKCNNVGCKWDGQVRLSGKWYTCSVASGCTLNATQAPVLSCVDICKDWWAKATKGLNPKTAFDFNNAKAQYEPKARQCAAECNTRKVLLQKTSVIKV